MAYRAIGARIIDAWPRRTRGTARVAGALAALALLGACAATAREMPVGADNGAAPGDAVVSAPVVTVAQGSVRGTAEDGGIHVFRGIPYAAPPVGPLRWQPPRPAPAWQGTRDATAFGPSCPQGTIGDGARTLNPVRGETSEDCLTLNVWAPAPQAGAAERRRPVMLWLHGGAHRIGSGSAPFYDGTAFARDGVVLVTVNYRLGLLGYFAHPALTAQAGADAPLANYGTMDQVAALRWVRDNIAAFGGDPDNVTVFGESAGGVGTLMLLTAPEARGLFAKAIVESGGGWNAMPDLAAAERSGIAAARAAGLPEGASAEQLRALPVSALLDARAGVGFGPVMDGRFARETIASAFAGGRAADVPLLIGFNSDEGSLMESFHMAPEAMLANLPAPVVTVLRNAYGAQVPDDAALARRLFADGGFSAPARWVARMAAGGAPSYLYRFDYVPVVLRARRQGTQHGAEIPFVFDSWNALPAVAGLLQPEDVAETATVHQCWVNFARTGRPSCAGAPEWPAYAPDRDVLMHFAVPNRVETGFDARVYDLLERALLPRALGHAPTP